MAKKTQKLTLDERIEETRNYFSEEKKHTELISKKQKNICELNAKC